MILDIKKLSKSYGKKRAVKGISLGVEKGTIFGLIGPNGAGKTTILRVCMGLIPKTAGSVSVFGLGVEKNYRKIRSKTGYLPEERGLYTNMTAYELLGFFAEMYGVSGWEKRADSLLKKLNLYEDRNRKIGEFSKGMKQKLSLIRALIHAPELLILDEPTSGLDPKSARAIISIIKQEREKGRTIILSTHLMNRAEELCDGIAILSKGKIIAMGTVRELKKIIKQDTKLVIEVAGFKKELRKEFPKYREGVVEVLIKNESEIPGVLRRLSKLGVGIKRMEIIEPSLEDVFVKLVK